MRAILRETRAEVNTESFSSTTPAHRSSSPHPHPHTNDKATQNHTLLTVKGTAHEESDVTLVIYLQ